MGVASDNNRIRDPSDAYKKGKKIPSRVQKRVAAVIGARRIRCSRRDRHSTTTTTTTELSLTLSGKSHATAAD